MSRDAHAATRVAELRDQISAADHAYYVLDQPILSDAEYEEFKPKTADGPASPAPHAAGAH